MRVCVALASPLPGIYLILYLLMCFVILSWFYTLSEEKLIKFFLSITQENPQAIIEIKEDIRTECLKFGEVKKILVFDVSRFQLCICLLSSFIPLHLSDAVVSVM